jgi:hypothetical protein
VFLLFLLLAVQVIFNLYATSAVTAAAFDGARLAAGAEWGADPGAAMTAAEAHVKEVLGEYGSERVAVSFTPDPDDVVLTVTADNPGFLPPALRRPLGFDRIERTARVRIERER